MSISNSFMNSGRQNSGNASLGSRLFGWLKRPANLFDRRTRKRLSDPPLRAYLGVVGSTGHYPVANISSSGFYMLTSEQWQDGTRLPLRLERTDRLGFAAISRMAVHTCVIRRDSKGVCFLFLPINQPENQQELTNNPGGAWGGTRWADQRAINEMMDEIEAMQSSGAAAN
jgi:hypothetical protein